MPASLIKTYCNNNWMAEAASFRPATSASLGSRPIPRVYVDDCDAMVEKLRVAGVSIVAEPADQPWGERVARVHDPDGIEVILGSRSTAG